MQKLQQAKQKYHLILVNRYIAYFFQISIMTCLFLRSRFCVPQRIYFIEIGYFNYE